MRHSKVTHYKQAYHGLYTQLQSITLAAAETISKSSEYAIKMRATETSPCIERESELVTHLANGGHAKDIGLKMCLSPRTVEKLVSDTKFKYGAETAAQLVAIFFRNGWIK